MKLLTIEKVADLDRLDAVRGAVVEEQRMLVQVGLKGREARRVYGFIWILGVISGLIWRASDLVICDDIAAHQCSQARQGEFAQLMRLIHVGEAIDELRCSVQRVQRNIHVCPPR